MSEYFNLNNFQQLVAGFYSGDKVVVPINYMIQAFSLARYTGFRIRIEGELDGQRGLIVDDDIGNFCYRNNAEMVFTGVMPSGKPLKGKLIFKGHYFTGLPGYYSTFAEEEITLINLDDVPSPPPPNGEPPAICTEGQEKCDGFDRLVCRNGNWVVKEYNSADCGYTVPPLCREGERKCVGTTLLLCQNGNWEIEKQDAPECGYVPPEPPNGNGYPPVPSDESWFDRNKTTIIVVSAIVLVAALIILAQKKGVTGVKSPFRSPLIRK